MFFHGLICISDDIWNLVYVKKDLNSSKSNKIPNEEIIKKLENRNNVLYNKMKENNIKDKRFIELETSIKKDYVRVGMDVKVRP